MTKNNIFTEDVAIPEIVLQKADSAFLTIRTERSHLMTNTRTNQQDSKKYAKRVFVKKLTAAAACMAIMITAGAIFSPLKTFLGYSGTKQTDSFGKGSEDTLLSAMNRLDNLFTLQVKAAGSKEANATPLEEAQPVPIALGSDKTNSWVFSSDDIDGDTVNYCINLPGLLCEGEQIDSITYSINNGAFQIVQPEKEESIIADGQPYDGRLNTGSIGGDYDEGKDGQPSRPFETKFYKSITLNYDRQSDAYTWINICNERPDSKEIIQLLWNEDGNEKACSNGIQKMLDGTVITCTVNYKDNTSQSADIKVGSCVMTRREAGEPLDEGIDPEEKISVITLELQQVKDGSAH